MLGSALLIIIGNGVVANVSLKGTKAQGSNFEPSHHLGIYDRPLS
jgi:glycerol uptake facilitator-like aquaporin